MRVIITYNSTFMRVVIKKSINYLETYSLFFSETETESLIKLSAASEYC